MNLFEIIILIILANLTVIVIGCAISVLLVLWNYIKGDE